jgi:hypothetical protein
MQDKNVLISFLPNAGGVILLLTCLTIVALLVIGIFILRIYVDLLNKIFLFFFVGLLKLYCVNKIEVLVSSILFKTFKLTTPKLECEEKY